MKHDEWKNYKLRVGEGQWGIELIGGINKVY